ncbi:MAG: glycosyltransferase family 4 protein [Ignavibacteria bacterium]|nr:glycosyltransferase family 4 protein [Ignavibacteria bacterium]
MIPADKRDPLHALIYGRVDAIVNTCETHVRNIAVRFPMKPECVHLIRHMRDPQLFVFDPNARLRYRAEWGIGDDELVVGYVARIDVLKGTREFAASSDHFREEDRERIRLVVIGEPSIGSIRPDGTSVPEPVAAEIVQWLDERARLPHNRLVVRPFTTDAAGVMSAFDVFVLATYGEMYALTVLEAMMVGLPVIGTDTDGTP